MKKFFHKIQDKLDGVSDEYPIQGISHPESEAHQLASRTFHYFYSSQNSQFQGRSKSESTLGAQDHFGYVVWPVIISVHCFAEALPIPELNNALACLQAYWNPSRHGFCAWKMYPGNEDIYFDDNAHGAQALISAYQATKNKRLLAQAREILEELIAPSASKDGGVPWHINNLNARNACSTGPAAVAALRLDAIENNERLFQFAERALKWTITTLRDPDDGLIWDSLVFDEGGNPNVNKMKWTYNIGFAIQGFTLLYERTRHQGHLDTAISLAHAAMNPECPLFDRCMPDPSCRMYSDSSFFLHHLVDGYQALSKHAERERLRAEVHRIALWGKEFMYDINDGLYYRGSVPHTIDEERTKKFNQKFGLQMGLNKNGQERDERGELCKTLIGCASWARILFADEEMQKC